VPKSFIKEKSNGFHMRIEKPEKVVGYVLLGIGLIFIFFQPG